LLRTILVTLNDGKMVIISFKMDPKVSNENEYKIATTKIELFLRKGFANLSADETTELEAISRTVSSYEKEFYPLPAPTTIAEMIELKMYEMNLNQKKLAELLKIAPDKLSLILNGKRSPDARFLKSVHQQLGIDAVFLLNHI